MFSPASPTLESKPTRIDASVYMISLNSPGFSLSSVGVSAPTNLACSTFDQCDAVQEVADLLVDSMRGTTGSRTSTHRLLFRLLADYTHLYLPSFFADLSSFPRIVGAFPTQSSLCSLGLHACQLGNRTIVDVLHSSANTLPASTSSAASASSAHEGLVRAVYRHAKVLRRLGVRERGSSVGISSFQNWMHIAATAEGRVPPFVQSYVDPSPTLSIDLLRDDFILCDYNPVLGPETTVPVNIPAYIVRAPSAFFVVLR
ncbi:unnamed protein product [Cyclocybe aegerita]|uniref:Uncharacterized protein n=1 Tax=Cyclocybe aegerita TaxID=1973307 RepID=A0A8S0WYI3_CYCAE|nr:unnamed protein product [Cyclocybe aegerita]